MAEKSGFFTSVAGDRKYAADAFNERSYEESQRADGVVRGAEAELAVRLGANLQVIVETGVAFKSGVYYRNDSDRAMSLAEVVGNVSRIDRVVVRIDRAGRTMAARVLKGSDSVNPMAPVLDAGIDVSLATVKLDRTSGSYILTVTDARAYRPHFLTDLDSIDALAAGAYGKLLADLAQKINTGKPFVTRHVFTRLATVLAGAQIRRFARCSTGLLAALEGSTAIQTSTDNGVSWAEAANLGPGMTVHCLKYNMGYGPWAGAAGHVFRGNSGGTVWTDKGALGTETAVRCIEALDYSQVVLAGTCPSAKIYRSADIGVTWTQVAQLGSSMNVFALSNNGEGIVLAGTEDSIWRSSDDGVSFSFVKTLDPEATFVEELCWVSKSVVLAALSEPGSIFRSADAGLTWQKAMSFADSGNVRSICRLGDAMYASGNDALSGNEIWRSDDEGATWYRTQRPADGCLMTMYGYNGDIIGGVGSSVYRSTEILV